MTSNNNQAHDRAKTLKPEDIVAMKGLGQAMISPNGKWAAFVRSTAVLEAEQSGHLSNIWLVSTDGGEPLQLTNGPNRDGDPQWCSDSRRIAFVSRRNDDKNQIWVIPIAGGEAKQLTRTKNGASTPRWSPDGNRVAFLMQERDDKSEEKRKKAKDDPVVVGKDDFKQTHLWVINLETMDDEPELLFTLPSGDTEQEQDKSQRLTEGDFHVSDPQWSPDGNRIAFVASPSPKADDTMFNTTVQILDLSSLSSTTIRKLTEFESSESAPRWSPDGKQIAFLRSPEGYGQKDLYIIPADGGTSTNLTADFDRNVETPIWSPDGAPLYFTAMDGVRWHLYAIPEGGEVRQITFGDCVVGAVSIADDGDTVLCTKKAPNAPDDVWSGSIRVAESIRAAELKQITRLNPQLEGFSLGEVRVIQWQSSDGLEIEGLICLPVDYQAGKTYPLIVEPHGGPRSTRDLGFKAEWHYFSGEGFAIFAPNFRGSDGYGSDFATANFSDWGVGDYQDIMTGIDFLIEGGIADAERLVIGGWSYGGFMTAWMVTQTDRFKAAVNGCGVTNHVSMYGQTDIPSFMHLYFEGAPVSEQIGLYRRLSPMSYIHRVKTPTLILHGENDIRVPLPQSEEFYAGLKAVGVDVEFVKYPREGHSISEPRHRLDVLKRQVAWYRKYVG